MIMRDKFQLMREAAETIIVDMEELVKRNAELTADLKMLTSLLRIATDEIILLLPHKQGCCLVKKMTGQKTDGDKCDCGARNTPFFNTIQRCCNLF